MADTTATNPPAAPTGGAAAPQTPPARADAPKPAGRAGKQDETQNAAAAQVHDVAAVLAQAINLAQVAPKAPAVTRTEGIDESDRPGGCYLVEGRYVNAWGEEVDEPEDAHLDPLNVKKKANEDKFKASQDKGEGFDQHGNPVSDDARARVKVRQ